MSITGIITHYLKVTSCVTTLPLRTERALPPSIHDSRRDGWDPSSPKRSLPFAEAHSSYFCILSTPEARIGDWITNREVVDNLSLFRCQVEVVMHLIIVERADARCTQPERFCSKIHSLADGTCFEMHIAIAAVAVGTGGTFEIADHRKGYARIAREVLP